MPRTRSNIRLLTTREAAELLNVNQRTVLKWIESGAVRYVELPSTGGRPTYRIPLSDLLSAVSGTFDLSAALREVEAIGETTDEESLHDAE
jgi:excisionase family DNA binding protein